MVSGSSAKQPLRTFTRPHRPNGNIHGGFGAGKRGGETDGWGWMDVIHPDSREKRAENYRRAAEERKPLEEEQRIRRHDGTYRWFLVRAEPLLDDDGEVRYFIGSATDIHEQRTVLEKLEERVDERTREVR